MRSAGQPAGAGPSWSARRRQRRPPGSSRSQKTRWRTFWSSSAETVVSPGSVCGSTARPAGHHPGQPHRGGQVAGDDRQVDDEALPVTITGTARSLPARACSDCQRRSASLIRAGLLPAVAQRPVERRPGRRRPGRGTRATSSGSRPRRPNRVEPEPSLAHLPRRQRDDTARSGSSPPAPAAPARFGPARKKPRMTVPPFRVLGMEGVGATRPPRAGRPPRPTTAAPLSGTAAGQLTRGLSPSEAFLVRAPTVTATIGQGHRGTTTHGRTGE